MCGCAEEISTVSSGQEIHSKQRFALQTEKLQLFELFSSERTDLPIIPLHYTRILLLVVYSYCL